MRPLYCRLRDDSGAMLITVMLGVAIMSAVAVAILEDIRLSVRLTANAHVANQARWYGLAMEDWAAATLPGLTVPAEEDAVGAGPRNATMAAQLDDMQVAATLAPLPNCFNLNSLVAPDEETTLRANPAAVRHFERLLRAVGQSVDGAAELAAAVVDWIDPDTELTPLGAEDYDYSGLAAPYRTGNTRLAAASELRTVKGVTREVYEALRPYVCALPTHEPNAIDLNTLAPDEGPLLAMVFEDSPMRSALQLILAARPPGGFARSETVWTAPGLAEMDIAEDDRQLLTVGSRFYRLQTEMTAGDFFMDMYSLFDTKAEANRMLIWRQFKDET